MSPEDVRFKKFCIDQSERLGQFKDWSFKSAVVKHDYVNFLFRRCGNESRVKALIEAAILVDEMPTLADMNRLYQELFGAPVPGNWAPEVSGEDRERRKQFMKDWDAQERAGIEQRRQAFRASQERLMAARSPIQPIAKTVAPTGGELEEALERYAQRWREKHAPKFAADPQPEAVAGGIR